MPSLSQTHKSCMTLFFYLFPPIQKSVQWNKDLLVSGLQQYRKAWSPGFVFVMGNYYTATYANFSWNCLFFHRLYSNWNSLPMCSIHYHFLYYSSEFLTALFDLAYELSHPPKSTLMNFPIPPNPLHKSTFQQMFNQFMAEKPFYVDFQKS